MTIHSDWGRILHSRCPDAFLPKIPTNVEFGVGVIDGHLQLMCVNSGLVTWERFLQYLFVNPIKKLFDAGCPVVVLCFDSYDTVPVYKSMTQIKRCQKKSSVDFKPGDDLPLTIPHDTMAFMMNRSFKLKVIDMACALLPAMVLQHMDDKQRLIVDYKRVVEYRKANEHVPIAFEGMYPTGESDIKFARYVDLFGNALVHAIDGDYMAIALLYYALRRNTDKKIYIFRQLAQLAPTAAERRLEERRLEEENATKRRKVATSTEKKAATHKKTPKCWVDMQMIYSCISEHVVGAPSSPAAVHAMVVLMLCAGTDFSRPIPLIGPKRIWEATPMVATSLLKAVGDGGLNYTLFADEVIAELYKSVFARHVSSSAVGFRGAMHELTHVSSLSKTTIGRLPSEAQLTTTLKNINWVVYHYWTVINGPIHAPLDGSNGFVPACQGKGVVYEDLRAVKSS
jgi:hypothetical protein